jgi:hypothetical protein
MTARRPRLYLHIGTPKTGTTYLQDVCWHNRQLLASEGVLYPGVHPESQFYAVNEVMTNRFPEWQGWLMPGAWNEVVAEARKAERAAIISHELLCPADRQEADRALADLDGFEVHILCTARNLASQIPSVWQEDVKNGHTAGFHEFVAGLREPRPSTVQMADVFWDFQNLPAVLRTWGDKLPPQQVHVLTVPGRGAPDGLLWGRFAQLLDLRRSDHQTDVSQANRSLGVGEAELVRRINVALEGRLSHTHYQDVIKYWVATDSLAQRSGKTPIVLRPQDYDWVVEQSGSFVDEIKGAGYDVIGDLSELLPAAQPPEPSANDASANGGSAIDGPAIDGPVEGGPANDDGHRVDPEQMLDVSMDAIVALVDHLVTELDRPGPAPGGLKNRLLALSERHDAVMRLRKTYSRLSAARLGRRQ